MDYTHRLQRRFRESCVIAYNGASRVRRPTVEANRFGFATVPTHDSLFGLLMMYLRIFSFLFALSSLGWWLPTCRAEEQSGIDFFESKIRPLLIEHCYECHSVESGESSGNLLLDSAAASQAGGDRGPAVVPGNVDASLLLKAVSYTDADMEMPPSGKLSDDKIELLRQWIAGGAVDPREGGESPIAKMPSPLERDPKTHWAFVAPTRATSPALIGDDARDLVDAALLVAAEEKEIEPSGLASREVLIRRLYFDLLGLVPSHDEITAFVEDTHPLAYERVVDKLLAAPEYGERFGRHWMDVARYADTVGYDFGGKDRRLVGSERFRDWAIRAFASDMPYDDMVRHQLSGDRTDPENKSGNLDAMGFLTVGRKFLNHFDMVDDRVDVITRGLLGLTVACARCHDHKFDPVPTKDYYAMAGILLSSDQPTDGASPLMMRDAKEPRDERVMLRGQPGNRGDVAPRQFLTALRKPEEPRFSDGSGRAELAERIVAPENPLTYRVMANRIWTHLVGVPLVDTPSDFGFRTPPPVVPEVLDDLAAEFAEHRSVKKLVRRIVLSTTYQRSSDAEASSVERDPDNRYAMRGNLRRRDFEALRDSMLLVSGTIDRTIGGDPVDISVQGSRPRRSVYAFIDRQNLPGVFRTFDVASPDAHTPSRHYTTIPQQALYMMNSPLVIDAAVRTAESTSASLGNEASDDARWLEALFVRVLGRTPTNAERAMAAKFLASELNASGVTPDPRRLWQYGRATIDAKGFVTQFNALAVFKDNRWQFSDTYPDPEAGYVQLTAENGHPGSGLAGAVVRRWTAPGDGTVTVSGIMGHRQDQGDGIRATFAIGEHIVWQEVQKSNNRPYGPETWPIKKGQSLDLVADDNGTTAHDSFFWRANVRFEGVDGRVVESSSVDDFSGPITEAEEKPLSRREQLAQLLLLSNEFAFVD
jgi:hypothetical protein